MTSEFITAVTPVPAQHPTSALRPQTTMARVAAQVERLHSYLKSTDESWWKNKRVTLVVKHGGREEWLVVRTRISDISYAPHKGQLFVQAPGSSIPSRFDDVRSVRLIVIPERDRRN